MITSLRIEIAGPHCPDIDPCAPCAPCGPCGPKTKYIAPVKKEWKRAKAEARRKYQEDLHFCHYEVFKMPSPQDATELNVDVSTNQAWLINNLLALLTEYILKH